MPADATLLERPPLTRWKLSVDGYHRMAEAGILTEDDRVELIGGELIEMSPIGDAHAGTANRLNRLLLRTVGDLAIVAVQNPVRLDRHSEPQPDLALLRPRADDYTTGTPTASDVLLLIEIADSSLRYDRAVKLPLYARAGIADYWIVDLSRRVVEVHREPVDGVYSVMAQAAPGDVLSPVLLPDVTFQVAAFFR